MADKKAEFDILPEIPYGTRPRVLLTGNGINRSFKESKNVDSIIMEEWKKHYGTKLPKRNDEKQPHEIWKLPFPLEVVAATKDHVQGCMDRLAKSFRDIEIEQNQAAFVRKIVDTRFDAILTTNYSLEFEKSTIDDYSQGKVYARYKTTQKQNSPQSDFGIFQCMELPYGNNPSLWHIHGTALRKKSMVMGQMFYGKLLFEIISRANNLNREYRVSQKDGKPFHPKSWIDYFLIGDLYIFGFGLDFSESDIWWLLSFKKIAFSESRTLFYDRNIKPELRLMFECYDIETPSVFFEDENYVDYYGRICESIISKKD